MTLPNINLNGTAATELLEQQIQVLHNLRATLTSLAKSTPHGRDYPTSESLEAPIMDEVGVARMFEGAAQTAKYDALCRKLQLRASDHVLEIGSGWGGFACHAVKRYGCRVTTVTISQAQLKFARERFEREGVSDRVEIRLQDDRTIEGCFDKIVARKECRIDDHGGFGAAREEHFARLAKIREIMLEVEAIAEHCSDTVNAGLWPRHHGRRI